MSFGDGHPSRDSPPKRLPQREISPIPTAHLRLGESVMCVPLLKRTPMLRLESW